MASWMIAILFAVGGSTWVYTKMMRSTGGNSSTGYIVAGIAFVFLFLILWSLLSFFE